MKVILLMLTLVSSYSFAHGNIDNKHGACTLNIGHERGIHLTAYQPSTHEGEVYCQNAPDLVETTMVLDLMEEDSKALPFAFSIGYMNEEVLEPMEALPFQLYPQGSMLLKFMPKANGRYRGAVMFLDKDGHDTRREFDFYIGELGPNSREPSSTQEVVKWLAIFFFIFGGLYMLYIKRMNKEDSEF